ncbi:MAG: hypothetical protein QOE09_2925 [Ilumatobacteraceae bacterium]|jgi:uncharacterized membrane protein
MIRTRSLEDGVVGVKLDQRQRLLIAAPLGIAVAIGMAFRCPWQLTVLSGWDVSAMFVVTSVWTFIPVLDAKSTRRVATREDDSHALVDLIMVVACLVSLIGVFAGLAHAHGHPRGFHRTLIAVAVITVFLSWFTVHTLFTLRYARLYYTAPEGGIVFSEPEADDHPDDHDRPDYMDFAYVSFTVGMTFQVSDTDIVERKIRRTVFRHALLSYAFGTAIVGVAINVVGTLIG